MCMCIYIYSWRGSKMNTVFLPPTNEARPENAESKIATLENTTIAPLSKMRLCNKIIGKRNETRINRAL